MVFKKGWKTQISLSLQSQEAVSHGGTCVLWEQAGQGVLSQLEGELQCGMLQLPGLRSLT